MKFKIVDLIIQYDVKWLIFIAPAAIMTITRKFKVIPIVYHLITLDQMQFTVKCSRDRLSLIICELSKHLGAKRLQKEGLQKSGMAFTN